MIDWKETENELPKLKVNHKEGTMECSIDLLVSDGEIIHIYECYDPEIYEEILKSNYTHWIRVDEIELPVKK
jgi:hypothetical protein